ncbi:recombinase family protein [Reyranella sp. CPCC 100927]|uniref:recombinase family protein n=1 Tax=Reyranella sp. CPCC 100927 TaxID=2599616 RepID=UPI0011B529F9|nr:recombinase family protein [Reyranella sp. CPCC 100927]TWT10635.1 resolvase [Reyranella sp. CPCC 100927]
MDKFVAYLRVSTARQGRSGLGLEAQREAVRAFVASRAGKIIAPEFIEVESGKKDNRPKLTAALARCKATGATLVVAKLDRLSRNAAFLLTMRDSGVPFVAADMPDANDLTVGIMAVVAQAERKAISERTKAALASYRQRFERGEKDAKGRKLRKLGNPNGAANLVPGGGTEAASAKAREFAEGLLPMVTELEAEGLSLNAIARRFNEDGIQSRRRGVWTAKAIANLKVQAA